MIEIVQQKSGILSGKRENKQEKHLIEQLSTLDEHGRLAGKRDQEINVLTHDDYIS